MRREERKRGREGKGRGGEVAPPLAKSWLRA